MSTWRAFPVAAARGGARLHEFLAAALPAACRTSLRRAVGDGAVRVNGSVELRNVRLREGDLVEVHDGAGVRSRPAPRPAMPPVLAETAHALVLAKPPRLPTVPDRSGRQGSVHGLLAALRPGADLRIVHRLDRDTSGCLLVAKGLEAARHFDRELRAHRVAKDYVALVHGELAGEERVIDLCLGPDPRRPGRVVAAYRLEKGFRTAQTTVLVAERLRGFTLLHLRPATGRGHQLRVHLAAIGHPIVADLDYGGRPLLLSELKPGFKLRPAATERPLLQRLFLHAAAIRCTDADGAGLAAEAPLPDDLAVALAKVRQHRATRRCAEEDLLPCD